MEAVIDVSVNDRFFKIVPKFKRRIKKNDSSMIETSLKRFLMENTKEIAMI